MSDEIVLGTKLDDWIDVVLAKTGRGDSAMNDCVAMSKKKTATMVRRLAMPRRRGGV